MVLSGCAKSADDVVGAYRSPMLYKDWSCSQIEAEQAGVRNSVVAMAQKQDDAATRDAVAMGVGLVLFRRRYCSSPRATARASFPR
jgi:hypothetical protein